MPLSEQRRKELVKRRGELQRRRITQQADAEAASRRSVLLPLEKALLAENVPFQVIDLREDQKWLPRWIPDGYGRIPWDLAPATEHTPHDADWNGTETAVEQALHELAGPEDEVLLIYERPWLAVSLTSGAARSHLAQAVEAVRHGWGDLWVSDRGGEWIIRCKPADTLVCLPVAPTEEEAAAAREWRRERREAVEDLLDVLVRHEVRHWVLYPRYRREAGMFPPAVDWRNADKSLSTALSGEPERLKEAVREFLLLRCEGADKIQVFAQGVRIDIEPEGFLLHLGEFLDRYRLYRSTLIAADRGDWQLLLKGKWLYGVG